MKILVITQYFWPEEFRINDMCNALKEKGHEVTIMTGLPNYPQGKFYKGYSWFNKGDKYYNGMKLIRVPLIARGNKNPLKLALNYISFAFNSLFYIPLLMKENYDLLFVFQVSPLTTAVPAIILKWLKKVPISIYIQDLWPETLYSIINIKNRSVRKIIQSFCNCIHKCFDKIYIASKGYEEKLINIGIEANKISYLPNWAEKLYENDIDIGKKNLEHFNIVFAGNIGMAQSFETIIKAADLCKDYKNIVWTIIGDGSSKNWAEQEIKRLNLEANFNFIGRKPVSEMPKYFSEADALLVTLSNIEIFSITVPSKIQSYLAAGRPIIGCLNGEGKKIIDESKAGLTSPAEDYIQLSKQVIKLTNMDIEERRKMGQNGKEYFKDNFERELIIEKLDNYLNVLGGRLNV